MGIEGQRPGEPIRDPNYIELEGAVRLGPEQNFFNQPPFNIFIPDSFGQAHKTALRKGLSAFARKWHEDPGSRPQLRAIVASDTSMGIHIIGRQPPTFLLSLHQILQELAQVPYWIDYVGAKRDPTIYKDDGDVKKGISKPPEVFPLSYPEWLEERQARDDRLKALGIIEILDATFSQDRKGATLDEALPDGERAITKKWKVRKSVGF